MSEYKPKYNSYNGNPNVKRDGVEQTYTQAQMEEYKRCAQSASYFAENYCQVVHIDKGLVPFKLYPYQRKMFDEFQNNRFTIVLACRQSGKSISSVAYILWFSLFRPDETIAILANKGDTAKEMLYRITTMLENVPFFLQPGTKTLNKTSIEFSNNSRIYAGATSGSSIRGKSCSLIYLDEFAFVNDASTFYTSTYPVISSGKNSRVIITSTANGIGNMFHKLWEGAVQGTNDYVPFEVKWNDVPGRDEEWKRQTIANTSKLQFEQEFGNTFYGTSNTLVNSETLLTFRAKDPVSVHEGGTVKIYKEPEKGHLYMMSVDVSKGVEGDYSTFNVIDATSSPFEQVAVFRDNTISPILFPNIIYKYAQVYNNAYVLVENNDQGTLVCHGLYNDLEYDNVHFDAPGRIDGMGISMNKKVKRLGCSGIKDILESRKLNLYDEQTIIEFSTFISTGQTYQASDGNHDDLVMNLVLFGYFASGRTFSDLTDINLKQLLYEQQTTEITEDVLPFGYFDNGVEEITHEELGVSDEWNIVGHGTGWR